MGPSGSGKSTLMHILAALDRPTSGYVTIAGTRLGELSDTEITKIRRKHIGFVFQFFNLLPMLTAEENIAPAAVARGREAGPGLVRGAARARSGWLIGARTVPPSSRAASSSASRSRVRSCRGRPWSSPTSRPATSTRRRAERSSSSSTSRSRHSARRWSWSRTRRGRPRPPTAILFLADGEIVKRPRPRRASRRSSQTIREVTLKRDPGRAQRARGAEAPSRPDRVRDRPRRRDDQRHARPHGHDRQGVRHDLRRVLRQHGRRHHAARRPTSRSTARPPEAPPIPQSILARGARARRRGGRRRAACPTRTATKILKQDGKAINTQGAPSFGFGIDSDSDRGSTRSSSSTGAGRPAPTEAWSTPATADEREATRSARRSASATLKPVRAVRAGRRRSVRQRQLARHRHLRRLHDPDRAGAARREGQLDAISGRRQGRRRRRRSSSRTIKPILPRERGRSGPASSRLNEDAVEVAEPSSSFIRYFLLAFAGIALFVGAFVIFNTISITVAQRTRELATLRTIGASRRQILPSVTAGGARDRRRRLGDRALRSASASPSGLDGLFKAAQPRPADDGHGLRHPHRDRGASWSGSSSRCWPAFFPSIRATRIPPILAVREGAELPRGRFSRFSPYIAEC